MVTFFFLILSRHHSIILFFKSFLQKLKKSTHPDFLMKNIAHKIHGIKKFLSGDEFRENTENIKQFFEIPEESKKS